LRIHHDALPPLCFPFSLDFYPARVLFLFLSLAEEEDAAAVKLAVVVGGCRFGDDDGQAGELEKEVGL
jgi:hypothetical protein